MSRQIQKIPDENIKEDYEKFKEFGNQVLEEYLHNFTKMWSNLKPEHLEPFSRILLQHENIALKDQDELTENIRKNLQLQTEQAFKNFWHTNSVSEALISLEMSKKKFKSYEGIKWNMDRKTPVERTQPIRMYFKENRLRYLQAQLNFQKESLEKEMKENIESRELIQDVIKTRICVMDAMNNFPQTIRVANVEMVALQKQALFEDDSDMESDLIRDNNSLK